MRTWHRSSTFALVALGVAALLAGGCSDEGPEGGPGTLTATLASANAAEGAALVELRGGGVRGVSAISGQLFQHTRGDTVRVMVVRDAPGPISFAVEVADTTRPPTGVVLEVADAENRLRTGTSSYSVEFVR